MRIISGSLRGRNIDAPKGRRTHPMSDKMRGALFNMLGDITGLSILDAFAGSGAVALEAISHGAAKVLAIDVDKRAYSTILDNMEALKISKSLMKAVRANASGWSDNNKDAQFDIVIAAPPYDDLQEPLLQKLTTHAKSNGLYVLDWPGHMKPPIFKELEQLIERNYGDSQLIFYRKS